MRIVRLLLGTCLLLGLPFLVQGCSDDGPNPGALGKGSFRYGCLDDSDAACPAAGLAPTFPTLVGVGGELSLSFVESGEDKPSGAIFPASTSLLAPTSRGFRAVKAGNAGVLVRESDSATVMDFTTLVLRDVGGLAFVDPAVAASVGPDGEPLVLAVGERRTLEAFVVDETQKALAGAFAYEWTMGTPALVTLVEDGHVNAITVEAKKPGLATVIVRIPDVASPVTIALSVAGSGVDP